MNRKNIKALLEIEIWYGGVLTINDQVICGQYRANQRNAK
jgi:hypothetical protein